MKNFQNIKNVFKAEFIKYKRTPILLLVIGAPVFLASIFFLVYYFKADRLVKEPEGWIDFISSTHLVSMQLLFPLYIVLLMSLIHYMEHKSKGYSFIGTKSPNRWVFLFNKALMAQLLIFTSLIIYGTLVLLFGRIIQSKYPALFVFDYSFISTTFHFIIISLLSSFFLSGVQFWAAVRWKNMIIPLSIGMAGLISFLILIQGWKYIYLHPFAMPTLSIQKLFSNEIDIYLNKTIYISLLGGIMFYISSFIEFSKKNILG